MSDSSVVDLRGPTESGVANYDIEQAVLGSILLNNDVFGQIDAFLRPEHFADAAHGRMYAAMGEKIASGGVASPLTLRAAFNNDPALRDRGGSYLFDLAQYGMVRKYLEHAREIVALFYRRQIVEVARGIGARAAMPSATDDIHALFTEFEVALSQASEGVAEQRRTFTIHECAEQAVEQIEAAMRSDGVTGATTGITDLDRALGGLQPGFYVLGGRPAMGKTTFGESIGLAMSREALMQTTAGVMAPAVLFFSAEMSGVQLGAKALAMISGVPTDKQQSGRLSTDELGQIIDARSALQGLPLIVDDTASCTPQGMASRARRIHRTRGLRAVIVDHIQIMERAAGGTPENRVAVLTAISRALKMLSKELNIPVIALSQLSRGVEQRDDKRPMLSDLRESGSIEQDADVVMFLYRESYYLEKRQPIKKENETPQELSTRILQWTTDMSTAQNKCEVIIAKNRMGAVGSRTVYFDPARGVFADLQG